MIIVLGASGFIGSCIYSRLKESGHEVIGTYFSNKRKGLSHFDLENMRPEDLSFTKLGVRHLIISAASNVNIDDSRRNWERAHKLNVVKTKDIINCCFENRVVPIYISTDNVFDGKSGHYKETDQRNPLNCYGRIRYEVENYLLNSGEPFVILRMGKVFAMANDNTLITEMLKLLRKGRALHCSDDQIFSPLYIEELADFIKVIIKKELNGAFHLISIRRTSRYEIARALQDYFHLKDARIVPCKINSLGLLEERPLLIDLDDSQYRNINRSSYKEISYYLNLLN